MSYEDYDDDPAELDEYASAADYGSAVQWDPNDPYRKQKEAARKKHALEFCRESMLEVRPASKWMTGDLTPQSDLCGSLWRPGEMALFFGETGIGKSILATHIAETIARGRSLDPFEPPTRQRVLYLDFQLTPDQLTRRYSCPSMFPGRPLLKYRFSGRFKRTGYDEIFDIPDAFNGDLGKYFIHSLNLAINRADASVIIIDNLSYLDITATGSAVFQKRLRALKLMAAQTNRSILVITQAKPKRMQSGKRKMENSSGNFPLSNLHSPLSLRDLALGPQLADIADSVFAIGGSNFAPDVRYIKHLKSTSSEIIHGPENVLTYQLTRSPGMSAASARKAETLALGIVPSSLVENSEPKILNASTDRSLTTDRSALTVPPTSSSSLAPRPSPLAASQPFLGFKFLGPSAESDHHRDYAAEALAAEQAHQRELKRLRSRGSRATMVDGILDGSFGRYLRGE